MSVARRTAVVASVVLLLSMAGSVAMVNAIDRLRPNAVAKQALYIRSPKMLRRMSLGYTGLLADLYWTRAVQYFGEAHHKASGDFALLAPLLDIATELDPKLLPAYEFGANFLAPKPPLGAGSPAAALALINYGIRHNPDQWRLYYNLGFLYYTDLKDYAKASDAFKRGAALPRTNVYMGILAARMAQHAGEFETARILWYATYQNTKEAQIRENAVEHLLALQVDEEVTQLEHVVAKYREQTGRFPVSMDDLQRAGLIRGTPIDPKGHPYMLIGDGHIEVQDPANLYFITKGLPPGVAPPQPPIEARTAK